MGYYTSHGLRLFKNASSCRGTSRASNGKGQLPNKVILDERIAWGITLDVLACRFHANLVSTRDNQRWLFAAGANQEKYTEIWNMDKVSNKYWNHFWWMWKPQGQGANQNENMVRRVGRTIFGGCRREKSRRILIFLQERDGSTISSEALKKNLSSISTTPGLLPGRRSDHRLLFLVY